MLESLNDFLSPWASYYGDHTWLSNAVTFLHLAGLLWGGGRAVTADLVTLRSRGFDEFQSAGHLKFLKASHRDVLIGLTVATISGLLMFTSDFDHFLKAPIYWAKIAGVVVLLGNGIFLKRAEVGLELGGSSGSTAFGMAKRHAAASLFLWFATTLLGQLATTA